MCVYVCWCTVCRVPCGVHWCARHCCLHTRELTHTPQSPDSPVQSACVSSSLFRCDDVIDSPVPLVSCRRRALALASSRPVHLRRLAYPARRSSAVRRATRRFAYINSCFCLSTMVRQLTTTELLALGAVPAVAAGAAAVAALAIKTGFVARTWGSLKHRAPAALPVRRLDACVL
jgi:hypothetical protein